MIKYPHSSTSQQDADSEPNAAKAQPARTGHSDSTIVYEDNHDLKNHLLVAMPNVLDPNFSHGVTYVCEHNEEGAMGITINRPLDVTLGDILDHMKITCTNPAVRNRPVFMGGPVAMERGFVLHTPHGGWESTLEVTEKIGLTTSKDILQALADGAGPARAVIALGYSGWSAGQIESEIAENTWLTVDATAELIFDQPITERWATAARTLGIDMNLVSGEAGHA
ncbi:MAG: YqgE/AlgH family protein [Halothiobacillus sp.]|jgi:putative transcriptional regulator|uniref:YqgE/AlgH family protein n=1 Tax=Halothiobacillus sp. TaxID=1891311 RepID=UPI002AD48D5B|nr:YqgE/AlgH family protein [Halothiobacillus sp.]MDA3876605.1 YqgE/AlgH family protein [Halothiobacillus sp.]